MWEEAVLGTVVSDPQTMVEAEILTPSDFTGINRIIWNQVLGLHTRNQLEPISLVHELSHITDWDDLVGNLDTPEEFVARLLNSRGNNIGNYVQHILDASTRKSLKNSAALIAAEADDDQKDYEELLDYAEHQIMKLRRSRNDGGYSMADLYSVYTDRVDGLRSGRLQPAWSPQLSALNHIIDFVADTDYIIFAARPGTGKSSTLRHEILKSAQAGKRSLVFNYDNDPMDYAMHFVTAITGINNKLLRNPRNLPEESLAAVREAIAYLTSLPIRIVSPSLAVINGAVTVSRKIMHEEGFDLLWFDYIQSINNGMKNRNDDVGFTSNRLRAMGKEFNTPIIAAAQLSREVERRGVNATPQLSDLRDSGSLEQDATIIAFPFVAWNNPSINQQLAFPENRDPRNPNMALPRLRAVPIRYSVLKNRNGETGDSSPVKWDMATSRFYDLTEVPH